MGIGTAGELGMARHGDGRYQSTYADGSLPVFQENGGDIKKVKSLVKYLGADVVHLLPTRALT